MLFMVNKVEGVYPTAEEAAAAIERLEKEDYSLKDMTIVANAETQKQLQEKVDVEVTSLDQYKNDPVHDFRDEVLKGGVAILLNEDATGAGDPNRTANIQPNTVGPDGTRDYEEEAEVESQRDHMSKDPELTTDELEEYEKKY